MKKTDLIEEFYNRTDFTKTESKNIVEDILKSITESLKKKEIVKIKGFGTFKISQKKTGKVRDFKNNKIIESKGGLKINLNLSRRLRRLDEFKR